MKNLWNQDEYKKYENDVLSQRVYSSRLLGANSSLVLHGGGNTSAKAKVKNIFGETENILYIKGSGWDLATIEAKGFAAVKMEVLLKMAKLRSLSDSDMVRMQRAAMLEPDSPNPSVETILHALIPFTFVDHTHADAVVAITNSPDGENRIRSIYGNKVLYIPYVMPGFILAQKIYEMTKDVDWSKLEGLVLLNHGIFSFGDSAKQSYDRMISLVDLAESYLKNQKAFSVNRVNQLEKKPDAIKLAQIRNVVSKKLNSAAILTWDHSSESVSFSKLENVKQIAFNGPLTPDHVIQTKRIPMYLENEFSDLHLQRAIDLYEKDYVNYFEQNKTHGLKILDSAPRWIIWNGFGKISVGKNKTQANIISDITDHSIQAFQWASNLGGYQALSAKDIFDVEYWELEQAKLSKSKSSGTLSGKIAFVTGAASGIGKACVDSLLQEGACVCAIDISESILETFKNKSTVLPIVCDITESVLLKSAVDQCVYHFGGLDIVVANAGIFPKSSKISEMNEELFKKVIDVNLTSQMNLFRFTSPYLALGFDPTIIVVASKNVLAPGPGAAAYSSSKAALTQLARVAALEFAPFGIRVNMLHPHAVMDTGIWSKDVLESRAKAYNQTVEEYKKSNLLKVEISSRDVANLVASMASQMYSKITGAQLTIDGGSDRTI